MISILIPLYNEEQSLEALCCEIAATTAQHQWEVEIIFIDDGSTDGSWGRVVSLASKDSRVRGIRFRKNFGKSAALQAGFSICRGEFVITMDADLQDSPAEMPRLLAKLEEGFDLVNGWKKVRFDPWHKVLPSRVFNWMIRLVSGLALHDHNCGLKCYRSEVIREIRIYGELHRFITLLADARGFKVTEMEVHHRRRIYGESKYGSSRFLKGLLDLLTVRMVTSFGERPLHLFGVLGILTVSVGTLGFAYLAGLWIVGHAISESRIILICSLACLLFGSQIIGLGLLGELIIFRLIGQKTNQPGYSVAEQTEQIGN